MKLKKTVVQALIFCSMFIVTTFLALNKHSRSPYGDYNSEIFSDAAGYYIYLPATFIYGFNNNFPTNFIKETGLDTNSVNFKNMEGKVLTKYPIGVAIMEAPFFLLAHYSATLLNLETNGYSKIYQSSISVASAFYAITSLFLLYYFLIKRYQQAPTILTLILIFFGTNYYYYVIDTPGLSHVFSFFLISSFLYVLDKIDFLKKSTSLNILLFIISGMIILVRSSNAIILLLPLIVDVNSRKDFVYRVKYWFTFRNIITFSSVLIILFIPQLFYNHFISGKLSIDGYQNEHFIYLTSPQFLKVWFAPNNGLFLYNPLYILPLFGSLILIKKAIWNGWVILFFFLFISYTYASWWSTELGCGYGHRGFVEWLPLFSIGIITIISNLLYQSKVHQLCFFSLFLILIIINLKYIYSFDACFYGTHYWDWDEYLRVLFK